MILTEELFSQMKESGKDYSGGVIKPDGEYILTTDGHLKTLMNQMNLTEAELFHQVPENDSAMFWLIEHTGCVTTDFYSSVGMEMTPQQQKTYRALVEHGIIDDKYYDISASRKKKTF